MSIIGKNLRNAKKNNRQILEHNRHRPIRDTPFRYVIADDAILSTTIPELELKYLSFGSQMLRSLKSQEMFKMPGGALILTTAVARPKQYMSAVFIIDCIFDRMPVGKLSRGADWKSWNLQNIFPI